MLQDLVLNCLLVEGVSGLLLLLEGAAQHLFSLFRNQERVSISSGYLGEFAAQRRVDLIELVLELHHLGMSRSHLRCGLRVGAGDPRLCQKHRLG